MLLFLALTLIVSSIRDERMKDEIETRNRLSDKPFPETRPINKECIKNSTQTVSCNVSGNQPRDVQWIKVSKGTAKTIQVSLSDNKYNGGTVEEPSLCIKNFMMDDEGTYVCCAVNDAGIGSSNGTFLTYVLDGSDHQNLEDNFHRLVIFVVQIAGDVIKKYFELNILKAASFEKYLEKNIHSILHLYESHLCCKCSSKCCSCTQACSCKCKCKCILTRDQISLLFDHDMKLLDRGHTKGKDNSKQRCTCPYTVKSSASLSAVDFTLLSVIMLNVHGGYIHIGVDKKCEDIRKVRNYVFHQSDSKSIEQQEFIRKWNILKESTEYFLQFITDEQYTEKINKQINEIRESVRVSTDSFVQRQIFLEFWRDKFAELEERHQEDFSKSFSRFEQINMKEETFLEHTQKLGAEIEALKTVVNEVVIRVFVNDEIKNLLESTEKGKADEGQGTVPVLLRIDVPDYWDENDITKAMKEIHATQKNKEVGVKIKSYSIRNLDIIIEVLRNILNDTNDLHHAVMPLISGFLSYIDTKEKADVDVTMVAPEKLKLEIGPAKKNVIHGQSLTIECNIYGKPFPFTIEWTKQLGKEKAIVPLHEKYRYSGGTVVSPSLTINCFKKDDEGLYVCSATNEAGVGLSNESQLIYIEKPKVKISPDKQSVVRGNDQTLTCFVSGIPQPIVSWMRENNGEETLLILSPEKYTGGNVECPSLTITNFKKKDEGKYVCKAMNEAGEGISNYSSLQCIGNENAEFKDFIDAETCIDTMKTFETMTVKLGVDDAPYEQVFDKLRLELPNGEDREMLNCLKKFFNKNVKHKREDTQVLVVGAGPCGLRIAIETAFMGFKVVLVDKCDAFTRNNVLIFHHVIADHLKSRGVEGFRKLSRGNLYHISKYCI
ncbi:protein-methionine sulfoxide oxidase MICAL [Mytilus galloprovincialis]|uniref:Protein-methionine sulfoxide oxidase MICAL n=1 Tax=Mytilus galloprovincialis TaxID=29158 RepID=A0A8B6HJM7_MYTGA|nr:protein-methionine sulfoxide oxidase MICAL [Mytilus galloprovincialis]